DAGHGCDLIAAELPRGLDDALGPVPGVGRVPFHRGGKVPGPGADTVLLVGQRRRAPAVRYVVEVTVERGQARPEVHVHHALADRLPASSVTPRRHGLARGK